MVVSQKSLTVPSSLKISPVSIAIHELKQSIITAAANTHTASAEKEKGGATGWIILAICTCWLWGPLLIGAASVLFALCVTAIGMVIGLAAASFVLIIAGITLFGVGIDKMIIN